MRTKKKFLIFAIFVLFIFIFWKMFGYKYINFELLKEHKNQLIVLARTYYYIAVPIYMLVYSIIVICALPASALMTTLGGMLFGFLFGTTYAVISATLGAIASFLLVRYFFGTWLQVLYETALKNFNAHITRYGTEYLLLVHFIPIIPFFVINILAGLTKISTFTFIWTTFLGIIPSSLLYAYMGSQLTVVQNMRDLISYPVIIGFSVLILFTLIPMIYKRFNGVY